MTTTQSMIAGLPPVHPGELLREDILPSVEISKTQLAERLHVSRQTFHDILAGKQAVTAGMALRLGRLFGNSAEFWLRLQQTYDLKRAELELAAELATIEPLAAA